MFFIFACACGDRTKTARVSRGRTTSSVYWPLPVMKRRSSFRRTAAPIPVALMAVSSRWDVLTLFRSLPGTALGHRFCSGGNRLDDVVVPGAAADISVELLANGVFIEIVAAATHNIERGHDHPGRAEPALQTVMLPERFLHRMQRAVRFCQSFYGDDLGALALQGERGA